VATTHSYPSPVAWRYGGALFELASEEDCVDAIERELTAFVAKIEANADLRRLVSSPLFATRDQLGFITALLKQAGSSQKHAPKQVTDMVGNFLKSVTVNRRLGHLRAMIEVFGQLKARSRGEMTAEVTTAHALSTAQQNQLKQQLDELSGKNVALRLNVNPAILGGLVVRLGSRQLDTSLATKLSSLKMHLKEVG